MNQIRIELNSIKDIEKTYIQQKVEKAKDNKHMIIIEEENISKIMLSIDVLYKFNVIKLDFSCIF